MKVLLINGSPRSNGNTFMALKEVAGALEAEGVETEIVSIGAKAVQGCIACRRGGASAALDRLNKYFSISNMPVVSSQYQGRSQRGIGPSEQIFFHQQYAGGQLPVLEYRIRITARRGGPGCRGHADHAHSRPQHGLGAERSEDSAPARERAGRQDQLRPIVSKRRNL